MEGGIEKEWRQRGGPLPSLPPPPPPPPFTFNFHTGTQLKIYSGQQQ